MLFKIPEIKSTPLINDLEQTRQELSEIIEQFETSIDAIDHASWNDTIKFVKFGRLKDHTLEQLEFIKRKRLTRDINFLRVERGHAERFFQPQDTQVFAETRSFIKSLQDTERQVRLKHALENRNTIIIQAVMHWPHYLVGLSEEEHATFCEKARKVLSNDRIAEIDAAETQLNILVKTHTRAVQYIKDHKIEEDKVA